MFRLLTLTLFLLVTCFAATAFAGDHGKTSAEESAVCMHCVTRALTCEVCGPQIYCQECTDHMASCPTCAAGEMCEWAQDKMANGCEACLANMMTMIPCADCAKGMMTCNVCAPHYMCDVCKEAVAGCEACQDEDHTLCGEHLGAMFMCDHCMLKIVCPDHLKMMRACEVCASGGDCDECMNASLACEACIALHMPPADVEAPHADADPADADTDGVM